MQSPRFKNHAETAIRLKKINIINIIALKGNFIKYNIFKLYFLIEKNCLSNTLKPVSIKNTKKLAVRKLNANKYKFAVWLLELNNN